MGKLTSRKEKASRDAASAKQDQLAAAVRRLFVAWGRQGGKTRAANLSPEERSAQARRAVQARWKSRRKD